MRRHRMRERRKRHARRREILDIFATLMREGGMLVCGAKAFAKLDPVLVYALTVAGVDVRESRYAPSSMLYAIPSQPPMIRREPEVEPILPWEKEFGPGLIMRLTPYRSVASTVAIT